jgi:membrane protein required for colicin V production
MNWADYLILAVMLLSILIGLFRGFAREVLGIAGWVLAFWVAFTFTHWGSERLEHVISIPSVRHAAAFGGLFLVTLLVSSIITWAIGRAVQDSALSSIDRTLGGGFGVLRGLLVIAALLLAAGSTEVRADPWWSQSVLIPHLEWTAETLRTVVPEHWIQVLQSPSSGSVNPPPSNPRGNS